MRHESRRQVTGISLTVGLMVLGCAGPAAEPTPQEVLASTIAAYHDTAEFAGEVSFTIEFPDGRTEAKRMDYGRRGDDAYLALVMPDGARVLHVVAAGERINARSSSAMLTSMQAMPVTCWHRWTRSAPPR